MKVLWGFSSIFPILMILGCQSSSLLTAGGYKMIHMNNPECMGSSASGVLIVQEVTENIIKADIAHKSGYCESISGQVISAGGGVAGKVIISEGLKKSGDKSKVTTMNSNEITSDASSDTSSADPM